jgi:hypothetical protein
MPGVFWVVDLTVRPWLESIATSTQIEKPEEMLTDQLKEQRV